MSQFFSAAGPIIMAHRGGGIEDLENKLPAFRQSAELGYSYLETDVHLSQDGKLYMYHGPFSFKAPGLLPVDNPYDELEQLFQSLPDRYFSIDPKHELAAEPLAKLIAKYDVGGRVCITCPSDDSRTARVADLTETLSGKRPITVLSTVKATLDCLASSRSLRRAAQSIQADMFYFHHKVITPRLVRRIQAAGLKCVIYTVNDVAEMQRLLDWGVDGFMTDYPERAAQFIPSTVGH